MTRPLRPPQPPAHSDPHLVTGAGGGFEYVRDGQAVRGTQEPSDLASTLLYVADEGSGFLTGQTLNVSVGSAFL